MSKPVSQKTRLASIFVSLAIVIGGTLSLLQTMSIDYYSVLGTIKKLLPACVVLGGLGWVMGTILDKPKRQVRKQFKDLYLQTFANNSMAQDKEDSDNSDIALDIEPDMTPDLS